MLRIKTLNITRIWVEALDQIIENGDFPSRSEIIRVALTQFLEIQKTYDKLITHTAQILDQTAPVVLKNGDEFHDQTK